MNIKGEMKILSFNSQYPMPPGEKRGENSIPFGSSPGETKKQEGEGRKLGDRNIRRSLLIKGSTSGQPESKKPQPEREEKEAREMLWFTRGERKNLEEELCIERSKEWSCNPYLLKG